MDFFSYTPERPWSEPDRNLCFYSQLHLKQWYEKIFLGDSKKNPTTYEWK